MMGAYNGYGWGRPGFMILFWAFSPLLMVGIVAGFVLLVRAAAFPGRERPGSEKSTAFTGSMSAMAAGNRKG